MDALVSRALMIRLSLQPSPASETSAFNKIRAFSSRCTGLFPFRISASSRSRSSPLSRTTYFFTEISSAAMIASITRVATTANHEILSNWLKRATSAVKRATSTIPILVVAVNYDPIALGYVDNLARPGGNITGLFFQHLELLAKRFGLIKEMLPSVSRVAVFFDSFATDQLEIVQAANQSVGLELQPLHLQNPPYDFENAFRAAARSAA